jgi:hypothetical protein
MASHIRSADVEAKNMQQEAQRKIYLKIFYVKL